MSWGKKCPRCRLAKRSCALALTLGLASTICLLGKPPLHGLETVFCGFFGGAHHRLASSSVILSVRLPKAQELEEDEEEVTAYGDLQEAEEDIALLTGRLMSVERTAKAAATQDLRPVQLEEDPDRAVRHRDSDFDSTGPTGPEARKQMLVEIFGLLDLMGTGFLGSQDLRRFADYSGFEGSDSDWEKEFELLCADFGQEVQHGVDLATFLRMADDSAQGGCHCSEEEARYIRAELLREREELDVEVDLGLREVLQAQGLDTGLGEDGDLSPTPQFLGQPALQSLGERPPKKEPVSPALQERLKVDAESTQKEPVSPALQERLKVDAERTQKEPLSPALQELLQVDVESAEKEAEADPAFALLLGIDVEKAVREHEERELDTEAPASSDLPSVLSEEKKEEEKKQEVRKPTPRRRGKKPRVRDGSLYSSIFGRKR